MGALNRQHEGRRSHGWQPFFFLLAGYISSVCCGVVSAAGQSMAPRRLLFPCLRMSVVTA